MAGFELMTAIQNDVPVIWVIFNDDEYKLVKVYQLAEYTESALVEFENPDFAAYAKVCGADGYSVDSLDEFERAFRGGACVRPADRDRREDQPVGAAALQHVARGRDPRPLGDAGGAAPQPLRRVAARRAATARIRWQGRAVVQASAKRVCQMPIRLSPRRPTTA